MAQRHAGADALHIARAFEGVAQHFVALGAVVLQRFDGSQAVHGLGAVALWREQPVFELAAAHARHAGVEQREQGGRVFAAQGLGQL